MRIGDVRLPASALLLISSAFTAMAQPAPAENLDDIYRLEDKIFENGSLRLNFVRVGGTLHVKVAIDPQDRAYFDDYAELPVEVTADKKIVIVFPNADRYNFARIDAEIKPKKKLLFWNAPLNGQITFKNKKSKPFSLDGPGYRLQFKPQCFFRVGDGGLEDDLIQIELRYADDNEDFIYSKARAAGWDLISRDLDFQKNADAFVVLTHSNGEYQALDQLSRDPRVLCATPVSAPAGAPEMRVSQIPLGTILGSPTALPVTGLPIVRKWLEDFFKNSKVYIGDVRLGEGAQYFTSVRGPSSSIKFDNDDDAWVQLNLDLRIGSNWYSGSSFSDTIKVQIQDTLRAKAPGSGKEPPSSLYDVLKYWTNDDQSQRSAWGTKMDHWQRTFSTFLASKYNGQLIGGP
jgi:hypothetical protein